MKNIDLKDITKYVEQNIGTFHEKRIQSLNDLKLSKVLRRKNPYLFKAKHVLTAGQIVQGFVDAHLSSSEEAIFGDWLEGLAIFINEKVYGGRKSGITGIDLEFDKDNTRYIVAIKSGPNWGNSSQIRNMKKNFTTAMKTLRTSNSKMKIVAVNGCCYGKLAKQDKGVYYIFCGQVFWEFISGNKNLYIDIIEPLGHKAKEKNEEFSTAYPPMINKLTKQFIDEYCNPAGAINWEKLVRYNSMASGAK